MIIQNLMSVYGRWDAVEAPAFKLGVAQGQKKFQKSYLLCGSFHVGE